MSTEPTALIGLIRAAIVLATAFGAAISDQQAAAIIGFVAAVYVVAEIVLTWINRRQVTPTASPVLPLGKDVTTPSGGNATVTLR